ncbi:porin family protein [Labrenzia sp. 5N]|uniref:outer membrane protein n=1 Tax=unclassified Labrenzia TaxID=2648686 RepID=UPI0012A8EF62|nr:MULTISPECIES: outer membrane protein [unclassified Labrenzia]NKX64867.1 porin family protein [Labrenzia sp. 5N]QFT67210.1 Outer membrane protein PagN precursor [Labrenzia sp. THAF35]
MDNFFKRLSLTGFAVALSTAAYAADLPTPVIEHIPEVPAAGGWYLRGDIGYKIYQAPDIKYGTLDFYDEDMEGTFMMGAGVGYKFNNHFRTDFTIDYEFPAEAKSKGPCNLCGSPGYSVEKADIDVWTFMLNGYVDIGTWNRITPYVGAGVGASYVTTSNINFVNPNGVAGTYEGDSKWNFAWALMAGAAYDITPNLALDAGYRYLNIGDAHSAKFSTAGQNTRIEYKDLQAHEFRLGARYTFNTFSAPAGPVYYEPQGPITSNF